MRALLRLLLLGLLIGFLVHAVRRALAAGREANARDPRDPRADRGGTAPDQLVCGACGQEFDPEQSGWICPKCGK
jgi:hypothetical protein